MPDEDRSPRALLTPRFALAMAAGLCVVLLSSGVPVLDEESYLDIAAQLDWRRPYSWWRAWQPWGLERPADAYVYAHPPLFVFWVKAWLAQGSALPVAAVKVAAGLPWAMLLGWSAGRLAERFTRQPWWAAVVFLTAPITLLGLQRGLMPDLMCSALGALGIVSWVEGCATPPSRSFLRVRWLVLAGLALGAASFTKYPALALLLPLALHARRLAVVPALGWVALGFVSVWGAGEAWLWGVYGRVHLFEVLERAGEIGRGPLPGRTLGAVARLGLLGISALPFLLGSGSRRLPLALGAGVFLCATGAPEGTPLRAQIALAGLAGLGVFVLLETLREVQGSPQDRRDGDSLLLGSWVAVVFAAVVIAHNYSAPRYLLPLLVPLALLAARSAERRVGGLTLLASSAVLQLALGLGVTVAEHRFAHAQVEAAERALEAAGSEASGVFSGEWSFRWRLEQAGWRWWDGQAPLPPGSLVISATEAVPAALPAAWAPKHTLPAASATVRVVDTEASVSLYSETIGVLPLGAARGPLETALVWEVP